MLAEERDVFTVDPRTTARFSTHSPPACEVDINSSFVRILLSSDSEIYQINLLSVLSASSFDDPCFLNDAVSTEAGD